MESVSQARVCRRCKESKDVSVFGRAKQEADGLSRICKQCIQEYQRDPARVAQKRATQLTYRKQHKARLLEEKARWAAEKRTKKRGFSLGTYEYNPKGKRPDGLDHVARRARRIKTNAQYSQSDWQQLCVFFEDRCLACGATEQITVDHVIPIAIGGADVLANLQPLCYTCNVTKHHYNIIDYRDPVQLVLFLRKWQQSRSI